MARVHGDVRGDKSPVFARVYAIVRVERVRTAPALRRIYIDPVRLRREGILVIEASDLRVYGT